MSGTPLPISIGDITAYLSIYESSIPRREFDTVIFALDDEFRTRWAEK